MKPTRRSFLRLSALALPFTQVNKLFASTAVNKPIVVSTWDSGQIANSAAWPVLEKGGKALDAVEQAAIAIENDINCCVGLGGNPDRDGYVTLDASIMDEKANCGSVAFMERIKHPISVARKLMETTPHVFLAGVGAQQFALANGFPLESGELSPDAAKAYKQWLVKAEYKPVINIEHQQAHPKGEHGPFAPNRFDDGSFNHDTMGTIALDANGDVSGMCTTSGMGFKMRGRVGDTPIIGAGLFVDNEVGAATSSGQGEEVIRVCGTHLVVEFMRNGLSPYEACKKAVERIVKPNPERAKTFQVGFIAINKQGEVGAYSVQKGFNYTVTEKGGKGKVINAKSHFA
ncbi:isoaspartyl peptidase/L-asparaginase family protein [Dyadobacter frigoris]|uniref:N(4)-(Beta-N-acetylglucosaminyl)-L-asparaginase n=1 Tax=Dyadobacter frigoris TaxID=2576211 RepID=A0A4U6CUP8_9BACT|nr:N(4)-(beta-N-acetylglucosaminyl)-L-asparaginase [Dyadobacter frigoris]TKT87347.1 N(4)-(beta-N-acetylglucosaminyl)-L-asparaginase [Dyadobacter frigoris]GLU55662.1 asparaginase [Dyadobacter frigoris]